MKKKVLLTYSALAVIVAIGITAGASYASAKYGEGRDNLSTELSSKLGIEQSKVDQALKEIREVHQKEKLDQKKASLDEAVSQGIITNEQKEALLQRIEQNQQSAEKNRGELRQWAQDNGIDMDKLKDLGFGNGRGHGRR